MRARLFVCLLVRECMCVVRITTITSVRVTQFLCLCSSSDAFYSEPEVAEPKADTVNIVQDPSLLPGTYKYTHDEYVDSGTWPSVRSVNRPSTHT